MKKLILVSGGTGYIGSHTVVSLIESGYDVVIADNLSNSRLEVLDGIEKICGVRSYFEKCDLCSFNQLLSLFTKYPGIEAVIHFAALKAVGESVEKPLEYYENNLVSMINLLKAMDKFSVRHLVFSSSCTVYGQPDDLPVTEGSPVKKAGSPYGNSKQISEEIIIDCINSGKDMDAVLLRYFNPIGAHPSSLIGEYPLGVPLNLVPYITQTLAGKRGELKVYGNDYDTPDGTGIRDYIYVMDLARAHVAAIKRLLSEKNKESVEVFNLGTGKGLSVMEIINGFERVTGMKVLYSIYPRRPGDIDCIYADTSKANRELEWVADTGLDEILLSAWNWEKMIDN